MRGFSRLTAVTAAIVLSAAGAIMLTATSAEAINPCMGNNPPPSCDTGGDPTPPAPTAPSNLRFTGVFQTELDLAWTDNATTETGYLVNWTDQNTNATGQLVLGANATSAAITGLNPSHWYSVSVQAQRCSDAGCGISGSVGNSAQLHEQPANARGTITGGYTAGTYGYYSPSGWAVDWDTTAAIQISVVQDGVVTQTVTANQTSSGFNTSYPGYGDNHGFSFYIAKSTVKGTHTITLIARNVGAGSDAQFWGTSYTVPGPPSAATNLTLTSTSTSQTIGFTDNAADESGYYLQASTDAGHTQWTQVGSEYAAISGIGGHGSAVDKSSPLSGRCYRILMTNSYGDTPSAAVCAP